MNVPALLSAIAILLPLMLGVAAFVPRTTRLAAVAGPWAALPALALAVVSTRPWVVDVPWLMVDVRVGVDQVGWVFLVLAALTWLFAGVFAGEGDAFFLLSMAGSIGVTIARDAVTFFVCGALTSLSAYPLIVRRGDPEARRAGRAYLAFAVLGEALLVSGLLFAVSSAGTTNLDDLPSRVILSRAVLPATTLILLGCAVQAGAVPLHAWLPVTYAAAPTAVSAALSGTISMAGVLGVLRFLPIGYVSLDRWGVPVALLGVLATWYGVVMGLPQRDPKTVLAYSSISEIGFLTTAIGMGLVVSSAWTTLLAAILVYVLHHGLTKGALFLSVGVRQTGICGGAAGTVAVAVTGWLGLSLAGAPLTSGAEAKMALSSAIARTGMPAATGVVTMLSLGVTGTTLLVARLVWLLTSVASPGTSFRIRSLRLRSFRLRSGQAVRAGQAGQAGLVVSKAAGSEWSPELSGQRLPTVYVSSSGYRVAIAWLAAAASAVLLPWTLLARLTDPSNTLSMSNVGYIVAGLGIAVTVDWAARHGLWRRSFSVPSGDVLIPLERAASAIWAVLRATPPSGSPNEEHAADGVDRDPPSPRRE